MCLFGIFHLMADDQLVAVFHVDGPADDVGAAGRVVVGHAVPDIFVVAAFGQLGGVSTADGDADDVYIFNQLDRKSVV